MSRYTFALAEPQDDAELRARMAQIWMEGRVAVTFRREPSYFAASRLQGERVQVVKCVDTLQDRIVGMGSRAMTTAHVNGEALGVGYLADLRGDADVRRGTLLARGYRFLRELHCADPVAFYLSVIFDGNENALQNLVGGRAGLPQYSYIGRMRTPAIQLDFARRELFVDGVEFSRAGNESLPDIVTFIARQMPHKQFSPCLAQSDFGAEGRLHGLRAEDFYLARRQGEIVGCVAAWDQSKLRQTHIERYSPGLALARPFVNLASAISAIKPMPAAGARIAHGYLCLVAILDNDLQVFRGLLRHAYNALRTGPWHYAIAGLHESDPLAQALDEYRCIDAAGRMYIVHYPQDGDPRPAIDGRTPYFEMAFA